jgi:tetratricopeptide (TPR) repeat protein
LLVPFTIISLLGIALHSADTSAGKPSNSRISPAGPSAKGIDPGSATAAPGVPAAVPIAKGIDPGSATAAPGVPAAVPIDQAKVAALTEKVSANPRDVASLQGLGDAYFAANDYKNAALWDQKVLTVDPKNQVALLAAGAAQFNLGNAAEAKKQWLVAAALYPDDAEVHYDLGFLYMSQTPPDKARMTAEWKKVVAIDPNSSLAKTVATHLNDR